jgi:cyclic pyranopterin phosphate synthase
MSLLAPVHAGAPPARGPLIDRFDRRHTYLRVSVTDRCNFRCTYCMPAEGMQYMPRDELLRYEEIGKVVAAFVAMGVRRVRLTGGEPLLRKDIVLLVRALAGLGLDDLAMTTNGHLLGALAEPLRVAGLRRVNVSLDTVDPEVFKRMTRGAALAPVLAGVEAARRAGLTPVKLNAVIVRGENDHLAVALVERFAHQPDVEIRFIEHMPFDGMDRDHVPSAELRARLAASYTLEPLGPGPSGPAVMWRIAETGQRVGFISPVTEHFCERCNRLRLDATGHLRTCLSRDDAPSLRDLLRGGATQAELEAAIRGMVWGKVAGHSAHEIEGWRRFEGTMTRIGG